ncbi:MAG TPA: hypothetical protein VGB59_01065 [Allosphingosinicella sp.]|jgi:hypothetical protein
MSRLNLRAAKALDLSLAAFAAASAGFVAFAMPEPILSALVGATPLPDLLPAARPPLGDTARYAWVAFAALFTFAFTFSLLAAVDRVPRRRAVAAKPEAEAPRIRKADTHPDAPARRPLLASSEVGEPLELAEPVVEQASEPRPEEAVAEPAARPLPTYLVVDEVDEVDTAEEEPLAELAARVPESQPADDQSLSQLVGRIEFGLSRKRQALPPVEAPAAAGDEAPAPVQEKVGHRLRSAIGELQRLSGTGA